MPLAEYSANLSTWWDTLEIAAVCTILYISKLPHIIFQQTYAHSRMFCKTERRNYNFLEYSKETGSAAEYPARWGVRHIFSSLGISLKVTRMGTCKHKNVNIMCYHVHVIMHVKDLYLSAIRVGHCVLFAGFCMSLYSLQVLNRDINTIKKLKKNSVNDQL